MVKLRLLLIVAVALLACLATSGYAQIVPPDDPPTIWTDNGSNSNAKNSDLVWAPVGGVCTLTFSVEWGADFNGSGPVYVLTGAAPSPNDPAVNQTTKNRAQTTWTDWHVDITNGTLRTGLDAPRVYKVGTTGADWDIVIEGPSSFSAHTASGSHSYVSNGEFLSVAFNYDVTQTGQNVTISQYPTNTYPIPEPASIMGLVTGLLGFGFGIKRRIK